MSAVLVTGANRGLGYATARVLAEDGNRVYLAGRDLAKVQHATDKLRREDLDVHAAQLDVTSQSSIDAAVDQLQRDEERLDVLVNNAGVLPEASDDSGPSLASVEMFRTTFATNVFGVVAVTEALLPLLHRSARRRIVNVSSTMGSLAHQIDPESPYYAVVMPAYQSSKTALNSVTVSLSKKLAGSTVTVTSVCPGWVQTDLAPGNRELAPTPVDQAARVVAEAAGFSAARRQAASPT